MQGCRNELLIVEGDFGGLMQSCVRYFRKSSQLGCSNSQLIFLASGSFLHSWNVKCWLLIKAFCTILINDFVLLLLAKNVYWRYLPNICDNLLMFFLLIYCVTILLLFYFQNERHAVMWAQQNLKEQVNTVFYILIFFCYIYASVEFNTFCLQTFTTV